MRLPVNSLSDLLRNLIESMQPLIIGTLETFMVCKRLAVRMKAKARRLANRKRFRHYFVLDQMLQEEMQFTLSLKTIIGFGRAQLLTRNLIRVEEDEQLFGGLKPII
mgnify:CR=1 FL=1|jgi:hypothetical protein